MRAPLSLLVLILAGVAAQPAAAARLFQDVWKEDKRGANLDGLRHWNRLSAPDTGKVVEEGGRRLLRLSGGAKLQSVGVIPYGKSLELRGVFAITSPGGSAGYGVIDFATNVYYYAYLDKTVGKVVLQRGDGENATVLAEAAATIPAPATLDLKLTVPERGPLALEVLLNGQRVLQASEERPASFGSTAQLYIGTGPDAVVDLAEMTTISRR